MTATSDPISPLRRIYGCDGTGLAIGGYCGGSAGAQTRQFTVRIAIEDPAERLRSQMLAIFEISGGAGAGLAIPSSAVLIEADGSYVYVAGGNTFRRRAVQTAASGGGLVEVTHGLSAGERVVVKGAQLLESERLKSEIKTGD